ncbi:MAG: hypothetical protein ACYC4F_01275 [Armatimonadota bacterium]
MDIDARIPVAEYERRTVEQLHRLNVNRTGPGAPEGNTNRMKHGIYSNRLLSDEEHMIFVELVHRLRDDFGLSESADIMLAELAVIYFVKLGRALELSDFNAARKLDSMMRGHLKDLRHIKEDADGRTE